MSKIINPIIKVDYKTFLLLLMESSNWNHREEEEIHEHDCSMSSIGKECWLAGNLDRRDECYEVTFTTPENGTIILCNICFNNVISSYDEWERNEIMEKLVCEELGIYKPSNFLQEINHFYKVKVDVNKLGKRGLDIVDSYLAIYFGEDKEVELMIEPEKIPFDKNKFRSITDYFHSSL